MRATGQAPREPTQHIEYLTRRETEMVATRDEVRTGYKGIGTRPIRPDGLEKVTGRALYGADVNLPGALYGKVLRSPHAHARIRGIDTATADALPGVKAVVTSV